MPRLPSDPVFTLREPLVAAWPWFQGGDAGRGYGLFIRDWEGDDLPPPPCPVGQVRQLFLGFLPFLSNFAPLRSFRNLEVLFVCQLGRLQNLNFLRSMPRLRHLHVGHQFEPTDYDGVRDHLHLRRLEIFTLAGPRDYTFLSGCDALESLLIAGSHIDPEALGFFHHHLPALRQFEACGFHSLTDASPLEVLARARPNLSISYHDRSFEFSHPANHHAATHP